MTRDKEAPVAPRSPGEDGSRIVEFDTHNVRKLPAVNGRRTDWRDSETSGLTVRVSPDGHRVYALVYRYAGRVRRYTIKPVKDITVTAARKAAARLKGQVANGVDPHELKEQVKLRKAQEAAEQRAARNRLTVERLSALWLASSEAKGWRPATRAGFERFVSAEIVPAIGKKPAEDVRPSDVATFLDAIAERSPSSAARCFEVVRAMFRWSNVPRKGGAAVTANNPCVALRYVHKEEREETYTNDELRRIVAAVQGTEIEWLVPLILYAGTRSHETRAARWEDIDLDRKVWTVPPDDAKSGRSHQVPLSEGALRVLVLLKTNTGTGAYVFPAPALCPTCGRFGHMDRPGKALAFVGLGEPETDKHKGKKAKPRDKRADLGRALRLHDVRRTVGDRMRNDLDIPPHVVEFGVLAHTPPRLLRTYMPGSNLAEVRRALDRWSVHLDAILSGEPVATSNVVAFEKGRA